MPSQQPQPQPQQASTAAATAAATAAGSGEPRPQKSPFHSRSNSTSSFFASYPTTTTQTPFTTDPDSPQRRLRVAVIGSGLAGLTVGHLLSSLHTDQGHGQLGVDVHLFEKAQSLDYYPHLVRLYRSIGVKFRDADNTLSCFNVDNDHRDAGATGAGTTTATPTVQDPYLSSRSYRASLNNTVTLPDLPPFSLLNPFPFSRRVLGYCRIARDYLRILFVSKEFLSRGQMMDVGKHPIEWGNGRIISLREFLEDGGYSFEFAEFFVPLFACICTCSFERMMEYPACVVLEYVARCMPFGRMQVVDSSVNEVTEALSENIHTVHYGTKIEHVLDNSRRESRRRRKAKKEEGEEAEGTAGARETRGSGPVLLVDSDGQEWAFDHVIFATQANQAAATLAGVQRRKRYDDDDDTEDTFSSGSNDSDHLLDSRLSTAATNSVNNNQQEAPPTLSLDSIPPTHPFYESIKTLSKFPYERTQVIVHTDTKSFLPRDPQDWRLLNIAKSSSADILASPLNRISKELEHEMALRSKKAKAPRSSLFSLRVSSPLSRSNSRFRLPLSMSRRGSNQLGTTASHSLRAHFEDLETSLLREKNGGASKDPATLKKYNSAMATHLLKWDRNVEGDDHDGARVLQTTNPLYPPRPGTVIASAWFERPVVDSQSMKALDELHLRMDRQTIRRRRHRQRLHQGHRRTSSNASLTTRRYLHDQGDREGENESDDEEDEEEVPVSDRVWFVGSYASPGIPLSEGCVVSAVQVMDRIIDSEPSLQLAPSASSTTSTTTTPSNDSFLKMDADRRQARQQREESEQKITFNGRQRRRKSTVNAMYFAHSWKDALWMEENDRYHGPEDSMGGVRSKVWRSTNVFVEVGWMLVLYLVALVQWWMVMVVESLGRSGSRWAHA
ncbi:hypothetical protein BGX24_007949 [Mortierella sp. AD032]|nr:hypothetical protein BGX24_007949 [Mortierella sp. AD032]